MSKEVQEAENDKMVERTFERSLPAFVAAFTRYCKVTEKEIEGIQKMIDRCRKGVKT